MGRLLQLLFTRSGGKTLSSKMFGLCALLLFTGVAQALPFGGDVQCTLNYNIVHEEKCHHKQVCHEEHEVVVTTTLIEECENIVTMSTRMCTTPAMLLAMTVLLLVMRLVTAMATAIMESAKLMLVTQMAHIARNMLRRSATRSLFKTHTKSHTKNATQSLSVIPLL